MNDIHQILTSNLDGALFEYGFADLGGLLTGHYATYRYGISVIRRLEPSTIDSISEGPTREYFDHYNEINQELNQLVTKVANALHHAGAPSIGIRATVEEGEIDEQCRKTLTYPVSHKLVATRAGLGWIGKTDLLVSKRFGPKIRLASILTTHPLNVAIPINESQCGSCDVCVKACPAHAANGKGWNTTIARADFFDPFKCRDHCRKITKETLGEDLSLCGKCIYVCPRGKTSPSQRTQ